MKREDGCVYCESVEQATPKSPRTEAKYQSQLKELEAEAAVMREALKNIVSPLRYLQDKATQAGGELNEYAPCMANNPSFLKDLAEQSLFFTAGKDLLDRLQKAEYKLADHGPKGHNYTNAQYVELRNRLQKAEAVVEAAKDTCEELMGHGLYAIATLMQALADMEGVTGDSE